MIAEFEASELISKLPVILLVTFLFGGWIITAVVRSITDNWRKVRQSEQAAALKQTMIEKGMSADDIVRVVNAGIAKPVGRNGGESNA